MENWNEIRIEPLPRDGENVEWVDGLGKIKQGFYSETDETFFVPTSDNPDVSRDFTPAFLVQKWRSLAIVLAAATALYFLG